MGDWHPRAPGYVNCGTASMSATVIPFRRHDGGGEPMKRTDVLLAALAAPEQRSFYPVHLQKTLFLVDHTLPKLFTDRYDFQPYDYGPFDKDVYSDAEALKNAGLVTIGREPGDWYRTYCVTDEGLARGQKLLASMPPESAVMIRKIANIVTPLSFRDLVAGIYKAFPQMKVNSVFKETL
jgi:hypothetical protein